MPWWLWKARMFERIGNRQLGEMKPITSVTPDQYPAILWGFSYLVRQGFAKETIWKEFRPGSAQPGCGVSCMSSMSGKANKSWSYLALGIGITRITCISVSVYQIWVCFGINHLLFVVSTWLLFSISSMGCHHSHWLSYFSRWLKPPTRSHFWGLPDFDPYQMSRTFSTKTFPVKGQVQATNANRFSDLCLVI